MKSPTNYAETVAYWREIRPRLGTPGNAYRLGYAGTPNRLFASRSSSAAAYRAGILNAKADKKNG